MNLFKRLSKRSTSESQSNERTTKPTDGAKSEGEEKKEVQPSKVIADEMKEKLKIDESEPPKSDQTAKVTDDPKPQTVHEAEEKKEDEQIGAPDNNNQESSDNNNLAEQVTPTSEGTMKEVDERKPAEANPPVEQEVAEKNDEAEGPKADLDESQIPDDPSAAEKAKEEQQTEESAELKVDDEVVRKPEKTAEDEEHKDNQSPQEKENDESSESEEENEGQEEDEHPAEEQEAEESLDEDQIKESPAYIPKAGQFYMHDQRRDKSTLEPEIEDKKERQSRADAGKWSHDLFDERQQKPKNGRELEYKYGSNIRGGQKPEDGGAPQAVRRDRPNFRQNHRPTQNRGVRHSESHESGGEQKNFPSRTYHRRPEVQRQQQEDQWPALPSRKQQNENPRADKPLRQNEQPKARGPKNETRGPAPGPNRRRDEPKPQQPKDSDSWDDEPVRSHNPVVKPQQDHDLWASDEDEQPSGQTARSNQHEDNSWASSDEQPRHQEDDQWGHASPQSSYPPQRSDFTHGKQQPRTFTRSGGSIGNRGNFNRSNERAPPARGGYRDEQPSGGFRHLNNAQPLPRREPRQGPRRQNEDHRTGSNSTPVDYSANQQWPKGQRYNQPPRRGPPSHTNVPPTQMISNMPSRGQVPLRQPTDVVYFDAVQQPRGFVERRQPRRLNFTAPAE